MESHNPSRQLVIFFYFYNQDLAQLHRTDIAIRKLDLHTLINFKQDIQNTNKFFLHLCSKKLFLFCPLQMKTSFNVRQSSDKAVLGEKEENRLRDKPKTTGQNHYQNKRNGNRNS